MAFNYEFPYTDPNLYNDDWLLKKMKELLSFMENIDARLDEYEQGYQELKQLIEDIESGNFPDSVKEAFYNWMSENALELVGSLVKSVFFGLTDDGYWVAWIPDSWDDIQFNTTDLDIFLTLMPEYGHLVLSY